MEPAHRQVPILEAAGAVGAAQIAIGIAVIACALVFAIRPPRALQGARRRALFVAGLVAAFLPVVIGHAALLIVQVRTLAETRGMPPDEAQSRLVLGMESASVHTWIGWTASGCAFLTLLLARARARRAAEPTASA